MITKRVAFTVAVFLSVFATLAAVLPQGRDVHLALTKSVPAADEVVESPSEIRLWFTQEPQDGVSTVRLVDGAGSPIALGELAPSPSDKKVLFAPVPSALGPGRYTVEWRAMAADGHIVGGDFAFMVRAE